MQKALHRIHTHDHTDCYRKEEVLTNDNYQSIGTYNTTTDRLLEKDTSQLTVSQRQSPETKI